MQNTLWIGLAMSLVSATAIAQRPRVPLDMEDAVVLARMCRNESGYPSCRRRAVDTQECTEWRFLPDCAAIDAVLRRVQAAMERARQRPVTYAEAAYAYSRRIFNTSRRDPQCDVAWLAAEGTEPKCWRHNTSWNNSRPAWLALLEHARRIRQGEIQHLCTSPPHHWGCGRVQTARGCQDHLRASRAGWTLLYCGGTSNYFYRVPRLAMNDRHSRRR